MVQTKEITSREELEDMVLNEYMTSDVEFSTEYLNVDVYMAGIDILLAYKHLQEKINGDHVVFMSLPLEMSIPILGYEKHVYGECFEDDAEFETCLIAEIPALVYEKHYNAKTFLDTIGKLCNFIEGLDRLTIIERFTDEDYSSIPPCLVFDMKQYARKKKKNFDQRRFAGGKPLGFF